MNNVLDGEILVIDTRVKIPDANITGKIDAIILEKSGVQYRVRYWKDDACKNVWVYPEEIMQER